MRRMQRALSLIYPDQCIVCETQVDQTGALCADCWRQTPFVTGLVCDACGVPLPGQGDGQGAFCDDCLTVTRPWTSGRAVMVYRDVGRRLVLALKHGDRTDLAPSAAGWMERVGKDTLTPDTVLVPIPIHWSRMLSRRYNQAAELSRALSQRTGLAHLPDALIRNRRTAKQDGMTVDERFANLHGSIEVHPRRAEGLKGKSVCLIDDVMTSGATLTVATSALLAAGAGNVCVLVLARVEKAP